MINKTSLLKIITISLIILISLSNIYSKQCKVLALEGGGDKGAYQAGALKGLLNKLSSDQTNYNYITGISLGALNAAVLASFPVGQEKQAADSIVNLWTELNGKRDVYREWFPFGILTGLSNRESLYDASPSAKSLKNLLEKTELQRQLVIGTTNAVNGEYEYFDNEFLSNDKNLIDAIEASGAAPAMFESMKINDKIFYEGAINRSLDIITGISKCKDDGYEEKEIIIDVLLCQSAKLSVYDKKTYSPLNAYFRLSEIGAYDKATYDIQNLDRYYPGVSLRYIIKPSKQLPSSNFAYWFKDKDIKKMIKMGEEDANNAIDEYDNLKNSKHNNNISNLK